MTDLSWSPSWASHVVGHYEPRHYDMVDGKFEPQSFRAICNKCGIVIRGICESGNVRQRIAKFAVEHRECKS